MFKLNMKIALRSLFKNKVYAAINIGGLALGLTAFVLILLYINYEKSYDSWSPELKNVYQIREKHGFFTPDNKEHWQESNDSRMAALVREKIPQTVAVTKVDQEWAHNTGYSVKIDHADAIMVKQMRDADSNFFHVFPYKFIQGNAQSALILPKSIVLKNSLAKKLFGTDKVLGRVIKVLMWRDDKGTPLTVTGVIADNPLPESIKFSAIMRTGMKDKDPVSPGSSNYCLVFARFNTGADTALLNLNLQKIYTDYKKASFALQKINFKEYYKNGKMPRLKALALHEVHSNPPFQINWLDKMKPVIGISLFLLLISVINFVNLATAQSVQRAKEVGVKKVLGSYKGQLVTQFLTEAALQSVAALFLSVVLIEVLLPVFNNQFNAELRFWHSAQFLNMTLQLLCLFAVVTLLAGFYPAWILSNYNPVSVLKGNYENGLRGVGLRNVLIVFQFVISVTFIIAIGVMHLQTKYISNKDLGFEKNRLINIRANYEDNFAERLKRIPGVQYVATTTQVMGNAFNVPEEIIYKGNAVNVNTVTVTMEALPALGVKILKGRLFSSEYKQDTINSVILNEAAAKLLGKNIIGTTYDVKDENKKYTFQIVGVIRNYHNEGFDKEVLPTVYKVTKLGGTSNTTNLLVRFSTDDNSEIIKKIEKEWNTLYPDFPMVYKSMDNTFAQILEENERFMNMVILFSVVSVSLSLLGLFALSTFVARRRTKEIAVRKILGASNLQIMNLLNKSFLILVVLANLISWPIAYIIINKWLKGFAYRIDMPVSPFIVATAISIIIAILTVSIQARKAAVNNPVDALKYE